MKFLLLKLNHIGDALLMTPSIRFLREKFPDAQIDVAVRKGSEQVLEGNPDINNLHVLSAPAGERKNSGFWKIWRGLFAKQYDYAFDLSNSDRSRLWMLLSLSKKRCANNAYSELGDKKIFYNALSTFKWGKEHQVLKDFRTIADILGTEGEPGPLVTVPQEPKDFLLPEKGLAVIHPTSRWAFKQWLPKRWAAVADVLASECGLKVLFSCGPDQKEIDHVKKTLSLAKNEHDANFGKLSLRELAWVLSRASLFCGVDTVVMHLAAAVGAPSVALFGPSSEWSWRPWQCRHELALGECSCKQTRRFVCNKTRPYPCMEAISVSEVMNKIRKIL